VAVPFQQLEQQSRGWQQSPDWHSGGTAVIAAHQAMASGEAKKSTSGYSSSKPEENKNDVMQQSMGCKQ